MQTRREFIAGAVAGAALLGAREARAADRPLLVSVITCRRPRGVSYLEGTLTAIDRELSGDRLLVCDGEAVEAPVGWLTTVVPPRQRARGVLPDNKLPGWIAIRTALEMGSDLLFLEDDIRPLHRGAFAEMAAHRVPNDAGWSTFFSRWREPGIYPAADFMFSQAVKIPHRSLAILAEAERIDPLQWRLVTGVDIAIAAFGRIARWSFEQRENLVEHIGLYSAANPT